MQRISLAFVVVMLLVSCVENAVQRPNLIHPINGEHVVVPVTFIWSSVDNSVGYRIEIGKEIAFPSPLITVAVGDTMYDVADLDTGMYYWRVAAYDEDNVRGEWAYPRNFEAIDSTPMPWSQR